MKITQNNKLTIEKMHLISGENKSSIRNFFESFLVLLILNYLEGEMTNIPFIGDVRIKHMKDRDIDGKKQAVIELQFEPDANLLRNIGQVSDEEEPDIAKIFKARVRGSLGDYLKN